jgi:hypothetical protein
LDLGSPSMWSAGRDAAASWNPVSAGYRGGPRLRRPAVSGYGYASGRERGAAPGCGSPGRPGSGAARIACGTPVNTVRPDRWRSPRGRNRRRGALSAWSGGHGPNSGWTSVQARSRCYAGGLLLSLSAIPIIYMGIVVNSSADRSNNVGFSGLAASPPYDRPVSRQHENSRRTQHVQLPDQVEPGFCIDLDMSNALSHSGYVGQDPACSPAWRTERARELQQRRPLA